ncbi:hypothetical protein ACTFIZ_004273 [Dictyostelium cf. discoideum]
MNYISNLLIILSLVSICLSQNLSSSSSSSLECIPGISGVNCTFNHNVTGYVPAYAHGGYVMFWGNFGTTHDGLSVLIGGTSCSIFVAYEWMIKCYTGPLTENTFYNVTVTQNGITWFQDNYYRYQTNCVKGQSLNGYCQCTTGFTGELCDIESSPYIITISSSSIDGGHVLADGWFGQDPQIGSLSILIGNKKLRIVQISPTHFSGVAPQGNGIHDITIYNSTTNQLLFTGINLYQYDSSLCYGDCFANGICNNGVCECFYPWTGPYCFEFSSCQCPQI